MGRPCRHKRGCVLYWVFPRRIRVMFFCKNCDFFTDRSLSVIPKESKLFTEMQGGNYLN